VRAILTGSEAAGGTLDGALGGGDDASEAGGVSDTGRGQILKDVGRLYASDFGTTARYVPEITECAARHEFI